MILDSVVAVTADADADATTVGPGRAVASGPGNATAAGEAERADADVAAASDSRFINAFSPSDIPGAAQSSACLEVASLQQQLEELHGGHVAVRCGRVRVCLGGRRVPS
jgi:hypothetical protein